MQYHICKKIASCKKLPEVISRETIKVLFASMDTGSMTGKRDFALFNVMYSTATRVDEVLSLKIADVALGSKSPCIKVTGKGSKLRCIYLLKSVAKLSGIIYPCSMGTPLFHRTSCSSRLMVGEIRSYVRRRCQNGLSYMRLNHQ